MLNEVIPIKNKIPDQLFIKVEVFDVNKRFTKPHKHNKYLELVFFTKGSGYHFLDNKPMEINPPIAFLIHKNQVHHWHIDTIPEGYVMIIKEAFLESIADSALHLQLAALKELAHINTPNHEQVLPLLFNALCLELKLPQVNKVVIESTLKALLSKLISYSKAYIDTNNSPIEYQFLKLLSEHLKNSVAYYANQLNTTPQNLNAICQKAFKKTASEVIADFIVKDAKRQLSYTNKSISTIAFELDFKDPSNFTKFFKRHTKLTPLQYKKDNLKYYH